MKVLFELSFLGMKPEKIKQTFKILYCLTFCAIWTSGLHSSNAFFCNQDLKYLEAPSCHRSKSFRGSQWLSWLSLWVLILARVVISGAWDGALHWALCWVWSLLGILSLFLCVPPPHPPPPKKTHTKKELFHWQVNTWAVESVSVLSFVSCGWSGVGAYGGDWKSGNERNLPVSLSSETPQWGICEVRGGQELVVGNRPVIDLNHLVVCFPTT